MVYNIRFPGPALPLRGAVVDPRKLVRVLAGGLFQIINLPVPPSLEIRDDLDGILIPVEAVTEIAHGGEHSSLREIKPLLYLLRMHICVFSCILEEM